MRIAKPLLNLSVQTSTSYTYMTFSSQKFRTFPRAHQPSTLAAVAPESHEVAVPAPVPAQSSQVAGPAEFPGAPGSLQEIFSPAPMHMRFQCPLKFLAKARQWLNQQLCCCIIAFRRGLQPGSYSRGGGVTHSCVC